MLLDSSLGGGGRVGVGVGVVVVGVGGSFDRRRTWHKVARTSTPTPRRSLRFAGWYFHEFWYKRPATGLNKSVSSNPLA